MANFGTVNQGHLITSNHNDADLLRLLREGDESAFTEIYHRYWDTLFFVAHKRLSSPDDAKEAVQNVFFTLWEKRHRLDIRELPLYLAGMIRFAIYRHLANEKRRAQHIKIWQATQQQAREATIDLDNKQLLEILTQFTETLPENYRIVFIQHKLLDRPLPEVAEELGVSSRTAEGYVAKLMHAMREHSRQGTLGIFLF